MNRPYLGIVRLATLSLMAALLAGSASAQSPDPSASYRTIESAHFRITFTPDLSHLATPAMERAEDAYALLSSQLTQPPKGRIDILLSDNSDVTNGYATPFPSNRIVIWVKPPVAETDLSHFRDWLDLVIQHELAHTFHLDGTGRVGKALRTVFGRVPFTWPFFPGLDSPGWTTEGLAVEFESRGTGSGRQHGSFHEMVVRTAVLENSFDPIDRVTGSTPIWPGGQRVYIYGSLFMDYLARKHGESAQSKIVGKTKGSILPPSWNFNLIGKRALGTAFTDEYEAWQNQLRLTYTRLQDSLEQIGLTQTERITTAGRYALHPRVSPDGKRLVYSEENGKESTHTRVIDLENGEEMWSELRVGLGPSDWLPDGSLITSELEVTNRYALRSDLYSLRDGQKARLTRAARIEEPDANSAGSRVVAVEVGQGSSRLVLLDALGQRIRPLTAQEYGTGWSMPRWSPTGDRIAVARWRAGGEHDVVVLDTTGAVVQQATRDEAVDGAPAWSPDGRYVIFWSDRTGIPNLFAFDTQDTRLLQVTNVLTGAVDPDVSPDGRFIYFAGYHADGYHIERMPYDPNAWRAAPAARAVAQFRSRTALDSAQSLRASSTASEPRGYSALKTLRPYFWLPLFTDEANAGSFAGAEIWGEDLVGRHSYTAYYAYNFDDRRDIGRLTYDWAGLGNPTLGVTLVRDWDHGGFLRLVQNQGADTSVIEAIEREDVAELHANFLRARARSSLSLTLGGELVRRDREIKGFPDLEHPDARDRMYGAVARLGYGYYRNPALAISREDGFTLSVSSRIRVEADTVRIDRGYRELTTWNTFYKSVSLPGFAHHVLAGRVSGLLRDGSGASLVDIGGVSGGSYDLGLDIASFGSSGGLLPVRGFDSGDRRGNRAWTASIEYRLPFLLVGRGYKLWPFFFDRAYLTAFGDAGNATCDDDATARFLSCTSQGTDPLVSAGGEIGANLSAFAFIATHLRLGVAQPISGPRTKPLGYISFGASF